MFEIILSIIFFVSFGLIVYTYIGYPVILYIWNTSKRSVETPHDEYFPGVSMIISAYNEENIIREKIENILKLDYPKNKIEVLFGLDGCSDETARILRSYKNELIKVFEFDERRGKSSVLNDLIKRANNEILIFSDANTEYEPGSIKKMTRHFQNPSIGGVCGRLDLIRYHRNIVSVGESVYWRFENAIKYMEGNIHTTLGATGGIYAIRKSLFTRLPENKNVTDDFLLPLGVVLKGYRVVYDGEAKGYEKTASSLQGEFSRKVRIGTANFFVLREIKKLLNPRWKFVSFALWSHKIIRWFVPFLMLLVLLTNVALFVLSDNVFFSVTFWLQLVFYAFAALGYVLDRLNVYTGVFGYPFFFVSMHLALLVGFFRFLLNIKQPTWNINR